METNNPAEAAYYSSLRLGSGNIKVSPSPVDGGGGDTGDLARRLLERDFENSKITIPANIKLGDCCLTVDPNLYQIEFESDESFIDTPDYYSYYLTFGNLNLYNNDDFRNELYATYPNAVIIGYFKNEYTIICIFTNIYVNDANNISKWVISEVGTPFQYGVSDKQQIQEIDDFFFCKTGDNIKEKFVQLFNLNIDPENINEMIFRAASMSKSVSPDYMFQINEPIEDPIKTCIFYNVNKETGEIKSNITSDIEYTQGESYVSLYSFTVEPTRGSSKGSIQDINNLIKSLLGEKDTKEETKEETKENEKTSSDVLKSDSKSETSTLFKFDDGSNFTEIGDERDLTDYLSDPDTNVNVFTKTNITDGSGNTLYILTMQFPSIYKSLPYVDFKEGKYCLYKGE